MARGGTFRLNHAAVGEFLKHDPDLAAAVDAAAEKVAARAGPSAVVAVDHYTTDRHVAGVVVAAHAQARDGVATRAAQSVVSEVRR